MKLVKEIRPLRKESISYYTYHEIEKSTILTVYNRIQKPVWDRIVHQVFDKVLDELCIKGTKP